MEVKKIAEEIIKESAIKSGLKSSLFHHLSQIEDIIKEEISDEENAINLTKLRKIQSIIIGVKTKINRINL